MVSLDAARLGYRIWNPNVIDEWLSAKARRATAAGRVDGDVNGPWCGTS